MIRCGCDVVAIERMVKLIENPHFVQRIFHADEIAACEKKGVHKAASFAARFAAKEAFFKALGIGIFTQGFSPLDVWILQDERSAPYFAYSDKMQAWLSEKNLSAQVSLSHDANIAMAMVVLGTKDLFQENIKIS